MFVLCLAYFLGGIKLSKWYGFGWILEALNKGEIPSTGSLVEVFNKKILERCLKLYEDSMTKVILPIHEESLQSIHEASRAESLKSFDQQHFGRHHAKKSVETLD
ncbi:putative guanylate-binding protein domain superfamily [Helianthus anomalus]